MIDVQSILRDLIAFDTTSHKPNRVCIDYIRDYLQRYDIASEVFDQDGKACLWATIGNGEAPGIILAGHTDTVPVTGQAWTSDPFTLTERDGRLFGRGACDMKGFIACVLAAIPELVKRGFKQPVQLAFTHDEETDMSGAQRLTKVLKRRDVIPGWVWIGEPTLLRVIDSHKGVATLQTSFTGVPGHSGQPDKGLNAIELAHDFIGIVCAAAAQRKASPHNPSRFTPPYSTFNLGIINGGTAENIIAEHCQLEWQARPHPGDTLQALLNDIEPAAAQRLNPRCKDFAPRAGFKTCICADIPPLLPTADNPGVKLLGMATGQAETAAVSFATEAGFFQQLGTHAVVCGPGSIDQAHKADEYVEIAQLTSCIDLLRRVL